MSLIRLMIFFFSERESFFFARRSVSAVSVLMWLALRAAVTSTVQYYARRQIYFCCISEFNSPLGTRYFPPDRVIFRSDTFINGVCKRLVYYTAECRYMYAKRGQTYRVKAQLNFSDEGLRLSKF